MQEKVDQKAMRNINAGKAERRQVFVLSLCFSYRLPGKYVLFNQPLPKTNKQFFQTKK